MQLSHNKSSSMHIILIEKLHIYFAFSNRDTVRTDADVPGGAAKVNAVPAGVCEYRLLSLYIECVDEESV